MGPEIPKNGHCKAKEENIYGKCHEQCRTILQKKRKISKMPPSSKKIQSPHSFSV